jgi:hypothetical protein
MRHQHVNPRKGRTEDRRLARVREALERQAAKRRAAEEQKSKDAQQ